MLLPNTLNPTPTSYHDVLRLYQNRLDEGIASGEYEPYVWPYRALGPHLLLLYLLLPPTNSRLVYYARYPLFAVIIYLSIGATLKCRSSMVTVGYGVGLINAWTVLWSATLIIFNDARRDFKRIEEHEISDGSQPQHRAKKGISATGAAKVAGESTLRARKVEDAKVKGASDSLQKDDDNDDNDDEKRSSTGNQAGKEQTRFVWQTLPPTFRHRLDWVCDLACNFRGVRWSHQLSSLPPPPGHIQSSLRDPSVPSPPPDAKERQLTRTDLIRRDMPPFLLCLLALDVLKAITSRDPYFWSLPASTTPSPFPYPRLVRTVLSLCFVYTSLLAIFLLSPLVFGVLLGPSIIGQHAWPWLYPSFFGSPREI